MTDPLAPLDAELSRLIATIEPRGRARIARTIAADMRTANAKRIRANVTPEGAAMEPRKSRSMRPARPGDAARKQRSLKPARMFAKAPGALVRRSSADGAEIGFSGAGDRIMAVHQFGLVDKVSHESGAPEVAYPERAIFGFSEEDRARLAEKVAAHIMP